MQMPEVTTDRLPPHDDKNECAALGCVLLDPSCLDVLASAAGATDFFYDLRHQKIFRTLMQLREDGQPISVLTLHTELAKSGEIHNCGGYGYVAGLMECTPSAAHLDYCIDVLRTNFIKRRMISACTTAVLRAYEHIGDAAELIEIFRDKVHEADALIHAKDAKPAKQILSECVERYERMIAGEDCGIMTGFPIIDMQGGFFPGEFVLVTGETGKGKSTLALNIIHRAIQSHPVGVFSLEMSDGAWMDRLLSLDLKIDRRSFRNKTMMTEGVMQKLAVQMPRLSKMPLWICDDSQSGADDIRRIVKHLVQRHGVKMVVVDYAQIVEPPKSIQSREQQVAFIGRTLRSIGQELGCVMMVLSQLNDEGKVRESRSLMHEAHLALSLESREGGQLWIACGKGRDMNFRDFPVEFDPNYCRLTQKTQMENSDD